MAVGDGRPAIVNAEHRTTNGGAFSRAAVAVLRAVFLLGTMLGLLPLAPRLLLPLYGSVLANPSGLCPLVASAFFVGSAVSNKFSLSARRCVLACAVLCALLACCTVLVDALARLVCLIDSNNPSLHPFLIHLGVGIPASFAAGFVYGYLGRILSGQYSLAWPAVPFAIAAFALSGQILPSDAMLISAPRFAAALSVLFATATAAIGRVLHVRGAGRLAVVCVCVALFPTRHMQSVIVAPHRVGTHITVLARNGSVSVFDDSELKARFLRVDHSIIGGVFAESRESAFGVFYYHEMHHYLANAPSSPHGMMLGYGVGSAGMALAAHGASIDAFEIDSAVAALSLNHFAPKRRIPVNLVVADGRERLLLAKSASYDFIIHDVFSGGGLPPALFTFEVFVHARRVLRHGGSLSVNFVGREGFAFKRLATTLQHVFPFVRCFVELRTENATNFVFFASDTEILFRRPSEAEVMGSAVRAFVLNAFFDNEVPLAPHGSSIDWLGAATKPPNCTDCALITDANCLSFAVQSAESASEHWRVMRSQFPIELWLDY